MNHIIAGISNPFALFVRDIDIEIVVDDCARSKIDDPHSDNVQTSVSLRAVVTRHFAFGAVRTAIPPRQELFALVNTDMGYPFCIRPAAGLRRDIPALIHAQQTASRRLQPSAPRPAQRRPRPLWDKTAHRQNRAIDSGELCQAPRLARIDRSCARSQNKQDHFGMVQIDQILAKARRKRPLETDHPPLAPLSGRRARRLPPPSNRGRKRQPIQARFTSSAAGMLQINALMPQNPGKPLHGKIPPALCRHWPQ